MKTTQFTQKAKVGVAGSFFNQLMSNNSSIPEIGKGATHLQYSDRDAYEVVEVSEDKKTVKLEYLNARYDDKIYPNGNPPMGHQDWVLEPTGRFMTVVWRHNSWKIKSQSITFEESFKKEYEQRTGKEAYASNEDFITEAQREEIYKGDVYPQTVIPGITKIKVNYSKINLLFGRKDYHYDWSF